MTGHRKLSPSEAHTLVVLIAQRERELGDLKAELEHAQTVCSHSWGAPVYDPIVRPAYTDQAPIMPSRWSAGTYEIHVPEQRTDRWVRTCGTCCKTEETRQVNETVTKTPRFG